MIDNTVHKLPAECVSIDEVRHEIDSIDRTIIELLSQRFEYVKEVVKYKQNTPDSIEAPARRQAVIDSRRQWALAKGLSPDVIEEIYDRLVRYFIDEEKKIKNL